MGHNEICGQVAVSIINRNVVCGVSTIFIDWCALELGHMVSMSKYRGTTRDRHENTKIQNIDVILGFNYYFPNIIWSFSLYELDEYRVSSIEYRVSSIEYRVSSIEYRVSSIEYRIQFWYHKVSKKLWYLGNFSVNFEIMKKHDCKHAYRFA